MAFLSRVYSLVSGYSPEIQPTTETKDVVKETRCEPDDVLFWIYLTQKITDPDQDDKKFFDQFPQKQDCFMLIRKMDEEFGKLSKSIAQGDSEDSLIPGFVMIYLHAAMSRLDENSLQSRYGIIKRVFYESTTVAKMNLHRDRFNQAKVKNTTTRDTTWFLNVFGLSTTTIVAHEGEAPTLDFVTCQGHEMEFGYTSVHFEDVIVTWSNLALLIFYIVEGFGTFTKSVRRGLHDLFATHCAPGSRMETNIKVMLLKPIMTLTFVDKKQQNHPFTIGDSRRIRSLDTYRTLHNIATDLLQG